MNLERAAMMGRLAEAKQTRDRLTLLIKGNSQQIRQGLNTLLTPVEELEVLLLDEQWDALKTAWAELLVVNEEIRRLEKELR
jgi:cell shape-determining protein MreC